MNILKRHYYISIFAGITLLCIPCKPGSAQSWNPNAWLADGFSFMSVQQASSADSEMLLWAEPLVVTASRTLEKISDSPAAVSVITDEDIRNSGLKNIP